MSSWIHKAFVLIEFGEGLYQVALSGDFIQYKY